MKREIIIATQNPKKAKELKELLTELEVTVTTLKDYDLNFHIVEDGKTLKGNAIKKAVTCARYVNKLTIADDSGLIVKKLGGKPGIFSSRFAGEQGNDRKNITKLLRLMQGFKGKEREACFVCFIAIAVPEGVIKIVSGTCRGVISQKRRGRGGFGYDPVFYLSKFKKTFAELAPEVKNKISHRGKALSKAKKELKIILDNKLPGIIFEKD
ncbi:MAG: XTP/dITP diphosphatase [Candidatus Omnitrophota bacterium]